MTPPRRGNLLRTRRAGQKAQVTNIELFFDLIFVFAVTQLSHALLKDLTPAGAARTLILFLAVWWVWIYTSWVTNWLDPDKPPVRFLLFALMFAGFFLSISIPDAFGSRGLVFACAYVFMQVARSAFTMFALRGLDEANARNFRRITTWLSVSALFWIAGGLARGEPRLWLFGLGLAIEYIGPSVGFWTPRLGRSATQDWTIDGEHIAERCSLFVIIALGESLLVTGATFGEAPLGFAAFAAFASAFVGAIASWWIYFDVGAEQGSETIATSADPGRLARLAYTYVHLLIVGGIIVSAAADELTLHHPLGHAEPAAAAVLIGGPFIFVLGALLFKKAIRGRLPLSHIAGLLALALLTLAANRLSPLALSAGSTLVLVAVAVWEWLSLGRKRGAPPDAASDGAL